MAAALAEGFDPEAVGEAISLAANHLLLCDAGRQPPTGTSGTQFMKAKDSVHGDSAGVHASDATNAWRHIARVSNPRNAFASLIVAAYNLGPSVGNFRGDAKKLYPLPEHLEKVQGKDAAALLGEAEQAIRANDQPLACAAVHRYGELGHSPAGHSRPVAEVRDQRGRRAARREVLPHRQRGVRRRPPRVPLAAARGTGAG